MVQRAWMTTAQPDPQVPCRALHPTHLLHKSLKGGCWEGSNSRPLPFDITPYTRQACQPITLAQGDGLECMGCSSVMGRPIMGGVTPTSASVMSASAPSPGASSVGDSSHTTRRLFPSVRS